jgi:hypothetical protein
MAEKQVDGSTITSSSTRNNHGVATRVGTSSNLTSQAISGNKLAAFASTVVDDANSAKANSSGSFAVVNTSPIAMRVTSSLAGVANTTLRSGANIPELTDSIHERTTLNTRKFTAAIRANKYNPTTNAFDGGYPATATDNMGTDNAANPARATPGRITFKEPKPLPVSGYYSAKTGG